MRRPNRPISLPVAAILVILLWAVVGHVPGGSASVRADDMSTPTATVAPTATATPSGPPPADDLLAAELEAAEQKDTVHLVEVTHTTIAKTERQDIRTVGDESVKKQAARLTFTTKDTKLNSKPARTTTSHGTLVVVGTTIGQRDGKKAWKCQDISSLTAALNGVVNTPTARLSVKSTDLGADTVSGIAVWHVRSTVSVPSLGQTGSSIAIDYYISEGDNTLVRQVTTMSLTFSGKVNGKKTNLRAHATLTADFSRYGDPVSITLPAACRKGLLRWSLTAPLPLPSVLAGPLSQTSTVRGMAAAVAELARDMR